MLFAKAIPEDQRILNFQINFETQANEHTLTLPVNKEVLEDKTKVPLALLAQQFFPPPWL